MQTNRAIIRDQPTDARIAILFAIGFAAVVATAQSWWTLTAAMALAAAVLADRPTSAARLRAVAPLIALIWLFAPWQWTWPTSAAVPRFALSQSGLELAAKTSVRAIAIVAVTAALFDGINVHRLSVAFARLPLPKRLSRLLTLTMRFLPLLSGELRRLRIAMACRGYPARRWLANYRSLALATGALLVRSVDRSDRVARAIEARTFGGEGREHHQSWTRRDRAWCVLALLVLASLGACEFLASGRTQ